MREEQGEHRGDQGEGNAADEEGGHAAAGKAARAPLAEVAGANAADGGVARAEASPLPEDLRRMNEKLEEVLRGVATPVGEISFDADGVGGAAGDEDDDRDEGACPSPAAPPALS